MTEVEAHVFRLHNGNKRRILDEWFPTVVRYIGVLLMFYATVVDHGRSPGLITAATGMILYKTVVNGNGAKGK